MRAPAGVCLLAAWGCAAPELPAGDPARPDVVLLSIDTLRADHVGAWGYQRDTTPFLDELARAGARFDSAWAPAPWTLPSHVTMLSGLLPRRHGVVEDTLGIGADVPLLQETLAGSGYATAGVVSTLYVSRRFGFDRGFQHFRDFGIHSDRENLAKSVDAAQVFEHALAWARSQEPGTPIFLFLHVYDVHYDYDPPPPWNRRFDRPPAPGDPRYRMYRFHREHPLGPRQMEHQVAQYDEEIAYVDDAFRRFHARWTGAGREAFWIVTSDHGEAFGERGSWGHAHTLWPEQLHVPWIVAGGGVGTLVVGERVGLEDLAPTLAGLAGARHPAGDGVDRSGRLTGSAPAPPGSVPAAAFAETSRHDTLRYRWHGPPYDLHLDLREDRMALCDTRADPRCAEDIASREPAAAGRLRAAMLAWLGEPWEARAAGRLVTSGVVLVAGRPAAFPIDVTPGLRFAVHPADAEVRFAGATGPAGPYRAAGGPYPGEGAPLRWHGDAGPAADVRVTPAERERLRALGYAE